MFFYLIKVTMWLLHVFLPIFSVLLHIPLLAIWAYGIYIQTSPDTIDPKRRNPGAPWYITKNCNVVEDKQVQKYCMQAKSSFAVSCIMLYVPTVLTVPLLKPVTDRHSAMYFLFLCISFYSLYPSATALATHRARQAEKRAEKEKWASTPDGSNEMTAEEQWQHMWELQQLPRTPGTANAMFLKSPGHAPVTPRTRAFGDLEGGHGDGYQRQELKPHPSWVAHAHGQLQTQPQPQQGQGWYAGRNEQAGFVQVQQVSPVAEQEEYQYGYEGKGKGVGFAH